MFLLLGRYKTVILWLTAGNRTSKTSIRRV